MEKPKFKYTPRILASSDENIRYQGSSGGVVAQVTKYLFETKKINSAISFKFSGQFLFEPMLVYNYENYEHTGSIYHEINLYKFLKENIEKIKSPILITCLPCQVAATRKMLKEKGCEAYIISLFCSNQLEKDATYYFLEKNNININDIREFRYRGNGWPSGIQIKTEDKEYFFHNNKSEWLYVFHSLIFSPDRCLACKDTFGVNSDVSVGDPWLKKYIENDNVGSSIVIANTEKGEKLIQEMLLDKALISIEVITGDEVVLSQKNTLYKKHVFDKHRKKFRLLRKIIRSDFYKKHFFKINKYHFWLLNKLIWIFKSMEGLK